MSDELQVLTSLYDVAHGLHSAIWLISGLLIAHIFLRGIRP